MKSSLKFGLFLVVAALAVGVQAAGIDIAAMIPPEVGLGLAGLGAFGTTKYSHDGKVIDYVNTTGAAIASGSVVAMGNTLGVALVDIAIGGTGSVGFGVFRDIPKVTNAVFVQGGSLTWDVSAGKFDDNAAVAATGDITGATAFAAAAGANAETTCAVCFTGVPGDLTA
ncbi:capsid cement protein [Polaromonas sp.]|uniref:capsid cement protein n=1 Tax=Polaromonas sp. TaxID=1869339 RepID=UPI003569E7DB